VRATEIEKLVGETIEHLGIEELIDSRTCTAVDCNRLAIDGKDRCALHLDNEETPQKATEWIMRSALPPKRKE